MSVSTCGILNMTKHFVVSTILFSVDVSFSHGAVVGICSSRMGNQKRIMSYSAVLTFIFRFVLPCMVTSNDVSLFTDIRVVISCMCVWVFITTKKNNINTTLWSLFQFTDNYWEGNGLC